MELEVVEGNIATLEVDAIANAANNHLWMGAGVAGAIKGAGGDEIEREAVAKGPIEIGDAVATGAGSLPAKHVIHGAVMGQDLRTNADLVAERRPGGRWRSPRSWTLARSRSPPSGRASAASRWRSARRSWSDVARAHEPGSLERVVFAVFGDEAEAAFRAALAE